MTGEGRTGRHLRTANADFVVTDAEFVPAAVVHHRVNLDCILCPTCAYEHSQDYLAILMQTTFLELSLIMVSTSPSSRPASKAECPLRVGLQVCASLDDLAHLLIIGMALSERWNTWLLTIASEFLSWQHSEYVRVVVTP